MVLVFDIVVPWPRLSVYTNKIQFAFPTRLIMDFSNSLSYLQNQIYHKN